ncbi:hypothetical protein JTE90_011708 [Oedothorax gibbosus]|uniref:Tudor domain-containing protein n=1 Tax=Oedothorax gibbosus TaxID=931172 RepID=A0AAV6UV01_9ARAC|nr:hypothetical protein JTE90_011708 [Oedothorax gibbosus]
MAHLIQAAQKELVVTYVRGEGILLKLWGLPISSLETVKKFEAQFSNIKLDLERTSGFLNSNQTPVGSKCAVFSKFKSQWCRARVLQVRGFSELLVKLLDYGNEEIVSVADLRVLDDTFFRQRPQAIECILADVIPCYNEWSPDAVKFCEQSLVCQTVIVCRVSQHFQRNHEGVMEEVPIVRIAKKGERDPFAQRLINAGLAFIKEVNQVQVHPQIQIQPQPCYKMNMLDFNTTHLVRTSFIENAQKFYVQLAAAELELKKLMDRIKRYTSTESLSLVHAPLVNTPCLAQFSSKQVYYRAVIKGVQEGRCSVLFVDYGCSELKDFQELRALPNDFLQLQAQAICCSLNPGDTASEMCFKAVRPGEANLLNCHVLGYNGELFLVKLTRHETEPQIRPRSALTPPQPAFYRRQALEVGKCYDVTVSFISDVTEFYCQLTYFKEHLDRLSVELKGDYFEQMSLAECLPNTPVCVKYSEDNIWYRAQIIKVNHERDIEVFFVDFGNYDNAQLQNVRKLKPEFMMLPIQALKCCLFEVDFPSDSDVRDDMFTFFEELTTVNSQILKAQVCAVTDTQCFVITLQEPSSDISINEKIQAKFSTINTVPISNVEQLYITSFTSPELFFAQFVKLSEDKLNQMQEQINEFYLTRRNTSFRPVVGSYVCAKYDLNGQYYRALVENVQGMHCNVFFIDYGNREVVAMTELHPMQKEFMANPQFGIECGLETYPPATPVDKLKILMEGAVIQARMLGEKNKKWTVSLTEDFQKNVSILEFLRQHEMLVPRSIHGAGLHGYKSNVVNEPNRPVAITGRSENFGNNSQQSNQSFDVMSIPLNACRNVYVSYVVSPSEFYVQIDEESNKLDELMKAIEETYTNNNLEELNINKLAVDTPCCAMFEDGVWYRGQIKKADRNECSVYFIDYGNTDAVPTSKVKVLQRQFFSLPPQALRCKSHNVSAKNGTWSDAEIDTFSDMTLEKSFVCQFVESDGKEVYSVNLISTSKLEEDILNKEFVSLVQGKSQQPRQQQPRQQPQQYQPKPVEQATQQYQPRARSPPVQTKPKHEAAPSNLRLPPPRVRVGSRESIVVPYGLNPGEVFCQLKSMEREFNEMMMRLQAYYNQASPSEASIDRPNPSMVCIAQFVQDMAWYRAEIRSLEGRSLTVCFVDYGNCEKVEKSKVRSITQEFASLPMQAIKCRIKGIRPPGQDWPTNQNISRYFEGESQCHFIEKSGDSFVVDILCNNRSVAQLLVKDGLAASDAPVTSQAPIAKQGPPVNVQPQATAKQGSTVSARQVVPQRQSKFTPGQLLSITVSFVESPYRFWCQSADESQSLEQLMADIEVQYLDADNLPIDAKSLSVGSYCMAKYSADEAWYRAQIKSCGSAGEYDVFFIDYGNSEVVASSQLASIHQEFLSLPPQCFECRLNRAPSTCKPETTEAFQGLADTVEEWTAKVEVVDKGVTVLTLLYEKDAEEVNVSDQLFGAAVPVEVAKFPTPDIPLGPKDGYVTEVVTPRDFLIQLAGIEDDLSDLSTKLSEQCEQQPILENPTVGCACAALYAEDNNWYRAEVIGLQDSTADVLFVDYGNASNVPKGSLRILSDSFLSVPPYAIKCKLNGIVPSGDQWMENSINAFSEMVLDSDLVITFISKDIPATVNILKEDKDVAQSLVDQELASVETCPETEEAYADDHLTTVEDNLHSLPSDASYPKRKLASMKLTVKICYVDSHTKFFCMPSELTTELDTVMKTLEILYSPSEEDKASPSLLNPLEDPVVSMACVAKYSEDESWYRAIVNEINGENISVSFVDYGNSESTTLENLRPMTPELMKIPPIAVECSWYGIQAVEGKEKEVFEKLENFCLEETELEMEVVVVAEGVYSVKLSLEGDLADSFVNDGLATIVAPETVVESMNQNLKTVFVELAEDAKSFISLRSVSLDKDLLVGVKHSEIENEVLVFYAVPNDLEDPLAQFQENLQVAYNQIEERLPKVANLDFCVAKYAEDELWYRAQVVSSEDNEIKVKFIDYGNSEIVTIENLCKLLPEFMSEPQFSITFCLSGCKVRQDKSEELQAKMDECFYEEPLLVKLCKYSHCLPAVCCIGLICGENDIIESFLQEKLLLHQFTVNPELINGFEASIESIVECLYYVLPLKFKEVRDEIQSNMKAACGSASPVEGIDSGRLYAANVEESWYRVAISSVTDDSSALVKCLDYGLDKKVELSKLRLLPEELCHCPLLLIPCLIANNDEAPGVVLKQDMKELEGRIFKCEVLNTLPLQFPLEIKISDPNMQQTEVQTTSNVVEEASLDDALKSIEDEISAYSDLVTEVEKDSVGNILTEMITTVEISQTDDEKALNIAEGSCEVSGKIGEENDSEEMYVSEHEVEEPIVKEKAFKCGEDDDLEEPIVKEKAYVCGEDDAKNPESEFEEFRADEENTFNQILQETDSFLAEINNMSRDMEEAAGDFVTEQKLVSKIIKKLDQSDVEENEPEGAVIENDLENGTESDGNNFGFKDSDAAGFKVPQADDTALSQAEDEFKELEPESQFPESEAESSLFKTENEQPHLEEPEANDDRVEEELAESDEAANHDFIESTESDNVENIHIERTESSNLENFDNAESDNVEETESDNVENIHMERTESSNLENFDNAESDNIEETESDNLENFENAESDNVESLALEREDNNHIVNVNNAEYAESDAVERVNNIHTTESDNIESAESEKLGVAGIAEDLNKLDLEGIPEAKGEDTHILEDLVESSKLKPSQRLLPVEDNEWDERPECDIKPENAVGGDITQQKTEISEDLLRQLIGTSWHKSAGKLRASLTDVSIMGENISVQIEPSPEELGAILFSSQKSVYESKSHDLPEPAVSNLCAVNFNNDWHRGKIVDIKEDTVTVSLIDSDMAEMVQKSAIKDLDLAHKAPLISAQCLLANVHCLPDKVTAIKDFLNSLLKDSSNKTSVQLVEANSPTFKIHLFLDETDILHRLLSEKMVVQKIQPLYLPSGQQPAVLSHLEKLAGMHVHIVSQLENLKALKDSMQGAYPLKAEVPIVESGVYAYKHGEAWARAQAVSSEQGLVLRLLDTGETATGVNQLYPLLPEHCLEPPYAVPCKIDAESLLDLDKARKVLESAEFPVNVTVELGVATALLTDENIINKISLPEQLDS